MTTETNEKSAIEALAEALRAAIGPASDVQEKSENDVTEALLQALNRKKPGGFS